MRIFKEDVPTDEHPDEIHNSKAKKHAFKKYIKTFEKHFRMKTKLSDLRFMSEDMRSKIDNFKKVFDNDEGNRIKIISLKAEILQLGDVFSSELSVERENKFEAIRYNKNLVTYTIDTYMNH